MLERNRVDIEPFREKFRNCRKEETIASFKNLGGESILISPCPIDNNGLTINPDKIKNVSSFQYMTHLVSFISGNNQSDKARHHQQVASLWATLGDNVFSEVQNNARNGKKVFWVSTDGRGVSWLHLRIDPSPKYYKFEDYKKKPQPQHLPRILQQSVQDDRSDAVQRPPHSKKSWNREDLSNDHLQEFDVGLPDVQQPVIRTKKSQSRGGLTPLQDNPKLVQDTEDELPDVQQPIKQSQSRGGLTPLQDNTKHIQESEEEGLRAVQQPPLANRIKQSRSREGLSLVQQEQHNVSTTNQFSDIQSPVDQPHQQSPLLEEGSQPLGKDDVGPFSEPSISTSDNISKHEEDELGGAKQVKTELDVPNLDEQEVLEPYNHEANGGGPMNIEA
jgi:hypothetical protein